MEIKPYIKNCNLKSESTKINNLLIESKDRLDVTILGARVLTVSGYNGSITLNEIAHKLVSSPENGKESIKLINTIKEYYNITDQKIQNCNWLTRRLNALRETPLFGHQIRCQIDFLKENIEYPC